MTPYIQQQLKSYAIIQIGMTICSSHGIKTQEIKGKLFITTLSHVQLNGLLENTEIVHVSFNGDEPKPGFYFEIPKDPNMYLILGILDEDERPRTVLLGKPKFNPQLN